jgi:hypothetical protein
VQCEVSEPLGTGPLHAVRAFLIPSSQLLGPIEVGLCGFEFRPFLREQPVHVDARERDRRRRRSAGPLQPRFRFWLPSVAPEPFVSAPIALAGRRIRCPILWWLQVAFGLLGTFKGAVLMSLISRASPGCPIQAVIASATRHSRTSPRVDGPSRLPAGHRWQPRSCGEAVGVRGAATSVTAIDLVAKASGRSYHRERADGWGETL